MRLALTIFLRPSSPPLRQTRSNNRTPVADPNDAAKTLRGRYPLCLATSTTSRRSFPKGKKKKEESRTPRMRTPKPPMCRKNAKSGRSRTCILHCAAASVTVLACPVLRVLFSFLGDARVALQSLNNGPNLSGCLQTDVEEACELRATHPAEITQALIPCTEKGFQNDGPEP